MSEHESTSTSTSTSKGKNRIAIRPAPLNAKRRAQYEARAAVIKAMGHPTRLFIVEELAQGERCVADLTEMVGADISTISKHLSVLRTAGIVQDEKRGSQVFYSLLVPCVMNFFSCVESVLATRARGQTELLR